MTIFVFLFLVVVLIYLLTPERECLTNNDSNINFIDDMLKDEKMYEYVINNNSDLADYLSRDNNTMSMYLDNINNKNKIYNSINKYIQLQSGKNNKLTTYISQSGLKMNSVLKKNKY